MDARLRLVSAMVRDGLVMTPPLPVGVVERVVYGEPAGPVVRVGRVVPRDPSGQCEQAGLIGRPAALHDRGHGEDRVPEAARHAGPVQERQLASS